MNRKVQKTLRVAVEDALDLSETNPATFSGQRHPWEVARRRVVRDLFAQTPPADCVLDVGCGDAYLLNGLAEWGIAQTFWGVDTALPEPRAYHQGQRLVNLVQNLDDVRVEPSGITHVTLLDVLEHVEDDVGLLRDLLKNPALAPGATFLVTVPAHPLLFTNHDRLLFHHRRYTRAGLRTTMTDAGLEVLACGGLFTTLLLPRLVSKGVEAWRGASATTTQTGTWDAPEALSRIVEEILWRDYRIGVGLRRRGLDLAGLSHFLIARSANRA